MDSKADVERYNACLVAKGFTQKESIDYKRDFLFDFFNRLVPDHNDIGVHFNFELH